MDTIFGQMVVNTKGCGKTTKCMVKACSRGLTEENTRVIIIWTKSKEKGYSFGLMAGIIMDNGKMESSRVKVLIKTRMDA
jgi:hypothetical protein